jgi:sec-independent protein translocase protein TatB
MYEFRKASNDFKFQMEEELRLSEEADRRKKEEAERARIAALPAPTQTIDAGANTAVLEEQASVSAQPSVHAELPATSSESTYPAEYGAESPAESVQAEHHVTLPRTVPVIQPPSTGETVPAARPGASIVASGQALDSEGGGGFNPRTTSAESSSALAAEAQDPSHSANNGVEPPPSTTPPEDPTRSETVSQHG